MKQSWTTLGLEIFIGVAILFTLASEAYPIAADAGDALNASGFPLGSFFVGGGIVFLIIAAAMLYVVVKGTKIK